MKLAEIQAALLADLADVRTDEALNLVRARYTGKDGLVTNLRKNVDFSTMPIEEKRSFGGAFNDLKSTTDEAIRQAAARIAASGAHDVVPFDFTLPGTDHRLGAIHPILSTQIEIEDIFRSMGFQVFAGDEAVSEFENFDALNIPGDHPARDMQDTFWLENGMVLRTHTSSMQNRALRKLGAPVRAIFPGRCFRNEALDITHENTFYQLEGLMVDRDVSVANLIAVMRDFLSQVFRREIEVRLRPGFFPFVEPGFELDFKTTLNGVRRWVELMPCGMVHPAVLRNAGIDPAEFSGFAFGLGLTRLAMLKHGVPDVRLFNKADLRFCQQFHASL
ncbi:phenylalanine--tRNA ligase alpha subunit [Deltaproteobacteria bacterium]|nr:phenylalanine--tRNA ligase alpha subunit [Deltaproteobacteria bacterium]